MFILSDVHGEKSGMKNFLASEEKYCIQLGDFGFIWKYNDATWNKFLNNFVKNYPDKIIFTVLGNHENYDVIYRLPVVTVNNAKCHRIRNNVFAVRRGEILQIEDKNILCVGGANSTDVVFRELGKSIWLQEVITQKQIEVAKSNIDKYDNIDYVMTHAAPTRVASKLFNNYIETQSETQLNQLYEYLVLTNKTPVKWFCGHYHLTATFEQQIINFQILGINEFAIV